MPASKEKPTSPDEGIAELRIELVGSNPPIWRRVQVPAACTLGDLHHLIQIVMDWDDAHLHRFEARGKGYVTDSPWMERDPAPGDLDADEVTLWGLKLAVSGRTFDYLYDFGDHWHHRIETDRALPREPGARFPRYVAGERAAPPEDSGGVYHYVYLLESLADPDHPEHEDSLDWVGEDFDSEALDLERINQRLERAFRG